VLSKDDFDEAVQQLVVTDNLKDAEVQFLLSLLTSVFDLYDRGGHDKVDFEPLTLTRNPHPKPSPEPPTLNP
jgi:hypothetical protein